MKEDFPLSHVVSPFTNQERREGMLLNLLIPFVLTVGSGSKGLTNLTKGVFLPFSDNWCLHFPCSLLIFFLFLFFLNFLICFLFFSFLFFLSLTVCQLSALWVWDWKEFHWGKLFLLFVSAVPWFLGQVFHRHAPFLKPECKARQNCCSKSQRGAEVTEIACPCGLLSAQSMPLVWHESCSLLSSIEGDHW